jgi:hypothetical protein
MKALPMKAFRISAVLTVLSLSLVVLAFAASPLASASTYYNCHFPECYDLGAAQNAYSGVEGQWDNLAINMPSSERLSRNSSQRDHQLAGSVKRRSSSLE